MMESKFDRIVAIGDIHGHAAEFRALINAIQPTPTDLIVTLGDYIDRGPNSFDVIEQLIDLHETKKTNIVSLRGNHEDLMIYALDSFIVLGKWLKNGGRQTLTSYNYEGEGGVIACIPPSHIEFIKETCVDWLEMKRFIFVHGGLEHDKPLWLQEKDVIHNIRLKEIQPHQSGKILVCGHSRVDQISHCGYAICIDTKMGVATDGKLTGLDINSGNYWQIDNQLKINLGQIEI